MDISTARQKDANDPLRSRKDLFHLPEGVIYLDGNSLGPMPRSVITQMEKTITQDWAEGLVRSWNDAQWTEITSHVAAKIAPLVGAKGDYLIGTDSVSVNIYKLAAAALAMRPGRHTILTEAGNFPTDGYVLSGLVEQLGAPYTLKAVPRDEILDHLNDDVALLLLTQVHYITGEIFPMKEFSAAARAAGALVLWDLSHSTGAIPVSLDADGADFAVGCGYKYLNGGPGAPAFAYVAAQHIPGLKQPICGWFGHAKPFAFEADYSPAPSIERMRTGTSGILGFAALNAALDVWEGVDMADVRAKSLALSDLFLDLTLEPMQAAGATLATPFEHARRGSHISYRHPHSYEVVQALIARGVIGDMRPPDHMRFGFTPLYLGYEDVVRAAAHLVEIMETGAWDDQKFTTRAKVI